MEHLKSWIAQIFAVSRPKSVLFRVDASQILGLSFGHLARCLILERLFRERYACRTTFLMHDYADGTAWAKQCGASVIEFAQGSRPEEEQQRICDALTQTDADWFLFDLPYADWDLGFLQQLGSLRKIVVDDFRFLDPAVDALLNSSILAPQRVKRVHSETHYFLGPDYFIIDPWAAAKPAVRIAERFNVVLSFGGSDPTDLTAKALSVLSQGSWRNDVVFRVVLGPGYSGAHAVTALVGQDPRFHVERAPHDLLPLLKGADLAICAGGRTMYELHVLKRPFLPIASMEHEAAMVAEFLRQGLIRFGMLEWTEEAFAGAVRHLISG